MIGDILQPTHLIFVLVIALLVLGPKRLPEVGRSLGRGLRDFRMAVSGEEHHLQSDAMATAPPPGTSPAATMATPASSADLASSPAAAPVTAAVVGDPIASTGGETTQPAERIG
jgi:sec-independent protein translocase protein TatA